MKFLAKFILLFCSLWLLQVIAASNNSSPVGLWKTIDDETGKPKAIVQISETRDQTLTGRILKIYPRPGYDQHELCAACTGANHNKPIVGLVILENLVHDKKNTDEWNGGNILDPKNGKTYHCTIQLLNKGERLRVRGYIGLPLFGRSQTWLRTNDLN